MGSLNDVTNRTPKVVHSLCYPIKDEEDSTIYMFHPRHNYFSTDYKTVTCDMMDELLGASGYHIAERSLGETAQIAKTKAIILDSIQKIGSTPGVNEKINPQGFSNWENGILDHSTLEISPHRAGVPTPEKMFLYKIPFTFDPQATCPKTDQLLLDLVQGDQELSDLLFMFIGYLLTPGQPWKKALILLGDNNNGKSTIIRLIELLVGGMNHTSVSLEEIMKDKFLSFNLVGKLVNTVSEIGGSTPDLDNFRKIIGGDAISVQKKGVQGRVARISAKFMMSTNELPVTGAVNPSYFHRLLIVRTGPTIPVEDRVDHLEHQLIKEGPGIWAKAIRLSTTALAESGGWASIKEPAACKRERVKYQFEENPVMAWGSECLELHESFFTYDVKGLYTHFLMWCSENLSGTKIGYQRFRSNLESGFNAKDATRLVEDLGKKKRGLSGVRCLSPMPSEAQRLIAEAMQSNNGKDGW